MTLRGSAHRLAALAGSAAGEVGVLLGTAGLLWLAAYLYELGYAAHFDVPLAHVDVGFPRLLLVLAGIAIGTAGFAAFVLIVAERAYPFLAERDSRTLRRVAAGIATAAMIAVLALVPDREPRVWLEDSPLGLDFEPVHLALVGGLMVHAAMLGSSWRRVVRERSWTTLAVTSVALIGVALLPAMMGWWQAGRRIETGRSYLVLQDAPDYRLVRLYASRALFARWDQSANRFDGGWRIERFDHEDTLLPRLTRSRSP